MTTKEKAEKLARGCAEQSYTLPLDQDWATDKIINHIPLEELLAVAEAMERIQAAACITNAENPINKQWLLKTSGDCLSVLRAKLKEAGVEL